MANKLVSPNGFVDWLYDEFSAVLDLGDGLTGAALSYAKSELTNLISWTGNLDEVSSKLGEYKYTNSSRDANNQSNSNYMSFTHTKLKSGIMHEKRNSYAAINFNNLDANIEPLNINLDNEYIYTASVYVDVIDGTPIYSISYISVDKNFTT